MTHKIEITKEGMILDGADITREVRAFAFAYDAQAPEGTQFRFYLDRLLLEDGAPKSDDIGPIIVKETFVAPDITITHDGFPNKRVILPFKSPN